MSTRYILAGGADIKNPSYWEELKMALPPKKQWKVLSCQFSQPEEQWKERFESFLPFFQTAFGENVKAELASPATFIKQLVAADIVYLHGGDSRKLEAYLKNVPGLQHKFKDKIVIGSSAGAQFLSRQYWSCGLRELGHGSALVDVNVLVHYGSDYGNDDPCGSIDWEEAKGILQSAIGDATVTLLPEGKFIVVDK